MNEQDIKDYLYSDEEQIPQVPDDFQDWKAKKKEAKQRFTAMQNLPYEVKVKKAELRAIEFMEQMDTRGCNTHVSVGGLDSITLLVFLQHIGIDIPAEQISLFDFM